MTLLPDKLVAHRGDQSQFPENTFESIQAALQAGAVYVETDVQLSKTRTPWLFHDRETHRLTGQHGIIHQLSNDQLQQLRICKKYALPTLAAVCNLLREFPKATLFIEAKRLSIEHFGVETMYQRISETVGDLRENCPLISFSLPFIEHAQKQGWPEVGVVFDEKSPPAALFTKEGEDSFSLSLMLEKDKSSNSLPIRKGGSGRDFLKPDYVFIDRTLFQKGLKINFPGARLAAYETSDPGIACSLLQLGADLVETDRFATMIQHD